MTYLILKFKNWLQVLFQHRKRVEYFLIEKSNLNINFNMKNIQNLYERKYSTMNIPCSFTEENIQSFSPMLLFHIQKALLLHT